MIKIVTIFDSNYASLGFSMMESAVKNINDEILFDIYPLDNFHDSIKKFCDSRGINYNYHDSFFKQKSILERKETREYSNFIFSLTPSILLESIKADNCDLMIYLDADTFFFNKLGRTTYTILYCWNVNGYWTDNHISNVSFFDKK